MLTRNWWAFALRGVFAIALGVLAFVVPGPTLAALIAVFAVFAIGDGVLAIVAGARTTGGPNWWMVVGGIAAIAIGAFTFISPETTAIALVVLIGIFSIARGVAEAIFAYTQRREIDFEWLLALSGVVSVAFGILLLVAPGAGVFALLWLIGLYAIFGGIVYLGTAYRLRDRANRTSSDAKGPPPSDRRAVQP